MLKFSESCKGFKGMSKGMSQVHQRPFPLVEFIFADNHGLGLAAHPDHFHQFLTFLIHDCGMILFEPFKLPVATKNTVFDDLPIT